MRASSTTASSGTPMAPTVVSYAAPKVVTIDGAGEREQIQQTGHGKLSSTPERPKRQSRRLRGEESVEIPSFSTPIEKIIRSAENRRKRDQSKLSDVNKCLGKELYKRYF